MDLLSMIKLTVESDGIIDSSEIKLATEAIDDGSDTSSIAIGKDTPFLDTQKQVVAVRPTQFSSYRNDSDSSLSQVLNSHFTIKRRP